MPELPEVESVRRTLEPHIVGRTVIAITLGPHDMLTDLPRDLQPARGPASGRSPNTQLTSPQSRKHQLLLGRTLRAVSRRGKQLILHADGGGGLGIHLGMTGQVLVGPASQPQIGRDTQPSPRAALHPRHDHVRWTLSTPSAPPVEIVFRDPRRFGALTPLPDDLTIQRFIDRLGPDGLAVTGPELLARCQGSARAIKAALLDQSIVAGVGNIYADEALFRARISPHKLASRLKPADFTTLAERITEVLREAVHAGGSTLRDYTDAEGNAGSFAANHAVYGRAGEPCLTCGQPLRQATVAQRTTVWCQQCQRGQPAKPAKPTRSTKPASR